MVTSPKLSPLGERESESAILFGDVRMFSQRKRHIFFSTHAAGSISTDGYHVGVNMGQNSRMEQLKKISLIKSHTQICESLKF